MTATMLGSRSTAVVGLAEDSPPTARTIREGSSRRTRWRGVLLEED
jgi:hypothetical protein